MAKTLPLPTLVETQCIASIPDEDADGDNETFAYFRDGEIIITTNVCNASLQVMDVTGRVVISRQGDAINRVSTNGMVPGVYVLRLVDGNDVRTQKIVIP